MTNLRKYADHEKILFRLNKDSDGYPPFEVEGLWAKRESDGRLVLDSIPFYAVGVGPGDEISIVASADGNLWFESLIKSSGVSVFRIHAKDDATVLRVRSKLLDLGCPSEVDAQMGIVAFEVPADKEINSVLEFLMSGQEKEEFDFEEALLRHPISDD